MEGMNRSFEERVAAGAEWLDLWFPGWEHAIDVGTLNLHNTNECICGHVAKAFVMNELVPKNYWTILDGYLNGSRDRAIELGFNLWNFEESESWSALTEAWIDLVKTRFDTGTLSG
jgi:hypothetical protein